MPRPSLLAVRLLALLVLSPGCPTDPAPPSDDDDSVPAGPDCDDLQGAYAPNPAAPAEPPWGGTIFLSPSILTDADPTSYAGRTSLGIGTRTTFDRRADAWVTTEVHLFEATVAGASVEVRVNTEFDLATAEAHADIYLPAIGRLPALLLSDLRTVTIHDGLEPFGGGNEDLLIHVLQGEDYMADGILEETLAHEAAHTSLDPHYRDAPDWLAAQDADGGYVSTYARDFPDREDLAESVVPYLAYRHRPDAYTADQLDDVAASMPNRMLFFDCLGLELAGE
ncbi:MAG: hypothetical protein KDA24_28355 [Deltaproteobacteria bacterium]|nr:hypothetical protein [Deltaproteobacteria bacterium]